MQQQIDQVKKSKTPTSDQCPRPLESLGQVRTSKATAQEVAKERSATQPSKQVVLLHSVQPCPIPSLLCCCFIAPRCYCILVPALFIIRPQGLLPLPLALRLLLACTIVQLRAKHERRAGRRQVIT
jgi:hypothetical protein